jgi:hypothetical protein
MPTEDTWRLATAEDDGKPLIFRVREQVPTFAHKNDFRHLLALSWPYEPSNDQGMPSPVDVDRMTQLEDLLMPAFEDAKEAFLTVVVTGYGVREWQWYARDPDRVMELVNATLGELEPFPVQFSFEDDPEWEGYTRFLEIGTDSEER